jgi:glycosyltransferase involved in cell wall biosynthesis
MPSVSILMPTFRQAWFLPRSIESLLSQTLSDWELIIVDDGSPDETRALVASYLPDQRISYHRFARNRGLGAALNFGMDRASAPLVAYLPSDDIYYEDHLDSLYQCFEEEPQSVLAYSGVRHHYNRYSEGKIDGYPLQLVQVMHVKTTDRWVEREELVTDDLERMMWGKLQARGKSRSTGKITCEWVDHPRQRHKILREPMGGINPYRLYYSVDKPLRFHTSVGNHIDEEAHFRRFRERRDTPTSPDGLKILLVGELSYNPERVLALEERGHQLFGLWTRDPYWYNMVGPLPFGHVNDLPLNGWKEAVAKIKPDVIYALLNWQAVPFVHHILKENTGVPFVWHFKEGPFICIEKGTWPLLVEIESYSDGKIYSSPEMRDWFKTVLPSTAQGGLTYVLDGDLPKRDWFTSARRDRLSLQDGQIHTVVPGRPIGLHPEDVAQLASLDIHLHFYGDFTHGQWLGWIEKTLKMAHNHIHLHSHVDQEDWVKEFSKYDAGWLHYFKSENHGDLRRANWDDLNYPARISTLVSAGLPLLQRDNRDHVVASQSLARSLDIGLFFTDMEQLRAQLCDQEGIQRLRESVWRQRDLFTFDFHADRLVGFFREVIDKKRQTRVGNGNLHKTIGSWPNPQKEFVPLSLKPNRGDAENETT